VAAEFGGGEEPRAEGAVESAALVTEGQEKAAPSGPCERTWKLLVGFGEFGDTERGCNAACFDARYYPGTARRTYVGQGSGTKEETAIVDKA
jgi:hypothetical protein